MGIFSLDVRPAQKGDCLIVHFGTSQEPRLMVIDGGPANVYKPHLRPRLDEVRKKRGLDESEGLPIDLLMVSHVDDDHIHGVLELTSELTGAKMKKRPLPFRVKRLWHNSFDDIIGNRPEELQAAITAQFGAAAVSGGVPTQGLPAPVAMVLASIGQGHQLRHDAENLQLALNPEFKGGLVLATGKADAVKKIDGLKLTVVGPLKPEVEALQEAHDKWLRQKKLKPKSPEAMLAAFADESVANLSSLVVLAEVGTRKMLLTGDARGDKVMEGLEQAKLLRATKPMTVDILKVPHHGSDRNMEQIFFERVTADHYVFSGNGEHGNPERETLQMLFDARPGGKFTLHFTYPIDHIDKGRKAEAKKKKKKWVDRDHALGVLLDERQAAGEKFKIEIVPGSGSHLIELADPVKV